MVIATALIYASILTGAVSALFSGEADGIRETENYQSETVAGWAGEESPVTVSGRQVPCYFIDMEDPLELTVYFADGVTDLPYVDLREWADVMMTLYGLGGYEDYRIGFEADGEVAQYNRENGYSMLFDFARQTITFEDYDAFIHDPGDHSLLDIVSANSWDEDGNPLLFQRIEKGSFDRYGKEITLELEEYGIPLYWSEGEGLYLAPLQTMGDFLLSPSWGMNTFFNGDAVYLASEDDFGLFSDGLTPLGESWFSAPYGRMSGDLAMFSYNELCLALDHFYGLKEIHDIRSFDSIFQETGYKADLCSTNPNVKDGALNDFIHYYLDDLHSGFSTPSYRTEEIQSIGGEGLSSRQDDQIAELYSAAREEYGRGIRAYEEVGNTAYITFDSFGYDLQPSEYYEGEVEAEMDPASMQMDTIALILYAHSRICREDSPIENVVLDLSLNGGGTVDVAAFVCAWYLGEASLSVRSSLTGAISTGTYRVDTNLDGSFDDEDTVADRKLYCLIGPYSFSCGNLVPSVLKSSKRVTVIGQESGGGSCLIQTLSTAYGSVFYISSPLRLSYLKNGSYYDIDIGVEPDCCITVPGHFYDREALTEYINKLF